MAFHEPASEAKQRLFGCMPLVGAVTDLPRFTGRGTKLHLWMRSHDREISETENIVQSSLESAIWPKSLKNNCFFSFQQLTEISDVSPILQMRKQRQREQETCPKRKWQTGIDSDH